MCLHAGNCAALADANLAGTTHACAATMPVSLQLSTGTAATTTTGLSNTKQNTQTCFSSSSATPDPDLMASSGITKAYDEAVLTVTLQVGSWALGTEL